MEEKTHERADRPSRGARVWPGGKMAWKKVADNKIELWREKKGDGKKRGSLKKACTTKQTSDEKKNKWIKKQEAL